MSGDGAVSSLFQMGAGFLAIMYFVAPLFVAWRARVPGLRAFEPAEADAFLAMANHALRRHHEAMGALDFRAVDASWLVNSGMRAQVLVYRKDGDPALGLLMQPSPSSAQVFTIFEQPFADGTRLALTNSTFASNLPRWDRVRGFRLAGATQDEAWRHFTALRRQHGAPARDVGPGNELADLEAMHRDTVAWLLGGGRYVTAADGNLRMSVRDAYLASWRMLWPMSTLLAWRDARRVRNAAREPQQA